MSDRAAPTPIDRAPIDTAPKPPRSALARWWDRRGFVNCLRWGAIIAFLGAWEGASLAGWLDPLFASSPSLILEKLASMIADGSVWPHVLASANIAALGFGLSVLIGVPMGLAMGRSVAIRSTLEPFTTALNASPQVAFLPLLIIWLGIGVASKVALVFLGSFLIMVINTEAGVAQVDRRLIETARSFMANERQVMLKVILPSSLPYIIAGMRLGVGRTLVMVVVAEIYAATKGLGYLIFQAGGLYDTAQVFVGVVILAGAGIAFNSFLRWLEKRLAPWQHVQAG
jgi:ABC-type nitrate/sulfonate/bicarbonate transport system permease component